MEVNINSEDDNNNISYTTSLNIYDNNIKFSNIENNNENNEGIFLNDECEIKIENEKNKINWQKKNNFKKTKKSYLEKERDIILEMVDNQEYSNDNNENNNENNISYIENNEFNSRCRLCDCLYDENDYIKHLKKEHNIEKKERIFKLPTKKCGKNIYQNEINSGDIVLLTFENNLGILTISLNLHNTLRHKRKKFKDIQGFTFYPCKDIEIFKERWKRQMTEKENIKSGFVDRKLEINKLKDWIREIYNEFNDELIENVCLYYESDTYYKCPFCEEIKDNENEFKNHLLDEHKYLRNSILYENIEELLDVISDEQSLTPIKSRFQISDETEKEILETHEKITNEIINPIVNEDDKQSENINNEENNIEILENGNSDNMLNHNPGRRRRKAVGEKNKECEYCHKLFIDNDYNMKRHLLYYCKYKNEIKEIELKKEMKKLQESNRELKQKFTMMQKKAIKSEKNMMNLQKCVIQNKLFKERNEKEDNTGTIHNNFVNNLNYIQNNNFMMDINNFGKEDLSHIEDEFMRETLKKMNTDSLVKYIEEVHYGNPRNLNIILPSEDVIPSLYSKGQMVLKRGNKWVLDKKKNVIDDMITINMNRINDGLLRHENTLNIEEKSDFQQYKKNIEKRNEHGERMNVIQETENLIVNKQNHENQLIENIKFQQNNFINGVWTNTVEYHMKPKIKKLKLDSQSENQHIQQFMNTPKEMNVEVSNQIIPELEIQDIVYKGKKKK